MDSILDSVKKVLGIDPSYTAFDEDIKMHINSTFSKLWQLGLGPDGGFAIEDKTATWTDFLGTDSNALNNVKSFMVLSVRLLFDPPSTSYAIQAMQSQIDEFGWRISTTREEAEHPWIDPNLQVELP